MRTFVYALLSGALSLWLSAAPASAQVRAELVSARASARPGKDARVALRLTHDAGWHTYWQSPGIGEPTRIDWTLPEGWTASPIDWPVPHLIRGSSGAVTGHGYEGVIHLPVALSVPADAAGVVRISARASWLMCQLEQCIPGHADLTLDLPIRDAAPTPVPEIAAALEATPMPEDGSTFDIVATRAGDMLRLSLRADGQMRDPHFYSRDEMIWHDVEQGFRVDDDRLVAALPIDKYFEGDPTRVSGVLAFTDAQGRYRGVDIDTSVASSPASTPALDPAGFAQALMLALLGGLILNLMPCVLPILSLKALKLAGLRGQDAREARIDGLLYTAGVVISFLLVAGVLLIARESVANLGWGFQLQDPAIVMTLALVMIGVGLNLLGVFEIGGGFTGVGQSLAGRGGRAGAFFTGVLAVIVATPCTAPFMASAIGLAVTQPAPVALAIFATLGLGLALPYLLVSLVPALARALPKPGAWMNTFKQALAFPMFLTAAWLLWVLGAQAGNNALGAALVGAILLGLCAWALAKTGIAFRAIAIVGLILAGVCVAYVAITGPTARQQARETSDTAYSAEALNALLAQDRAVFAYFTADWCVTCKVNEASTINQDEVRDLFNARDVTVMVGDWTNYNQPIADLLAAYQRAGVPLYLYFPPGSRTPDDARVMPQILTPDIVRQTIAGHSSDTDDH